MGAGTEFTMQTSNVPLVQLFDQKIKTGTKANN